MEPEDYYRVHKSPSLVPVVPSPTNPVHITPSYLTNTHLHIILPPTSWSS
jgi:hypothetical protein